jgi:hypothetical protein
MNIDSSSSCSRSLDSYGNQSSSSGELSLPSNAHSSKSSDSVCCSVNGSQLQVFGDALRQSLSIRQQQQHQQKRPPRSKLLPQFLRTTNQDNSQNNVIKETSTWKDDGDDTQTFIGSSSLQEESPSGPNHALSIRWNWDRIIKVLAVLLALEVLLVIALSVAVRAKRPNL